MKRIEEVLQSGDHSYAHVIDQLEAILMPFALYVAGKTPYCAGEIIKISLGEVEDKEEWVFNFNDSCTVTYDFIKETVRINNSDVIHLCKDDAKIIDILINGILRKKHVTPEPDQKKVSELLEELERIFK